MRAETLHRAIRFFQIINRLWASPRGLTTQQLSDELGVTRRTIQRDLKELQKGAIPVPLTNDGPRWKLAEGYRPRHGLLQMTLPEAAALLLAARLLQRASDETNPHVASVLSRLPEVLPEHMRIHLGGLLDADSKLGRQDFVRHFEALAEAWATQHTVHLWYQPMAHENELETDFDVYCLEPIAPSFAIYAIGFAHARQGIRTLKVERIVAARLTDRQFEVDPGFDAATYFHSGWGIMGGDELQTVRLRFAPTAVRRLRESQFHPSQQIEEEEDGSCIVTFRVAQPIEVLAFIRGWGPQVEVLEPADLRARVAREAVETARVYE